jgi:hypothetical protein
MNRRQSNNQWSGGIAAHPAPPQKNSECKNPLENFSPRFVGIRRYPPHRLSSKWPISAEYQSSLLVQLKDILKEKSRAREDHQGGGVLFLHDNAAAHQALATQKKLAYLDFQCLDHPPYSQDLALLNYHQFSELKKNS